MSETTKEQAQFNLEVASALGWTHLTIDRYAMDGEVSYDVWGLPPEFKDKDTTYGRSIPSYSNDASACIVALTATGREFELVIPPNGYTRCRVYRESGLGIAFDEVGATPCEAMCNALITYYKQKEQS